MKTAHYQFQRTRRPAATTAGTYRPCRYLLSRGEFAFFRCLVRALLPGYRVALKVRLADVITCPETRRAARNRISQKHLDFVLYDEQTTRIVLAIELDDRTHERPERQRRDVFLDQALAYAGVAFLRIRAASLYDPTEIQTRISKTISAAKGNWRPRIRQRRNVTNSASRRRDNRGKYEAARGRSSR